MKIKKILLYYLDRSHKDKAKKLLLNVRVRASILILKSVIATSVLSITQIRFFLDDLVITFRGNLKYSLQHHSKLNSYPELRRDIHRIEKGLIMQPRRDSFGERYIPKAFSLLVNAVANPNWDTVERKWAFDVFDEYFKVVKGSPQIDMLKDKFVLLRDSMPPAANDTDSILQSHTFHDQFKPYEIEARVDSKFDFSDFKGIVGRRRSIRYFLDKTPDLELVLKCIDLALNAPSACNRQPFRYLIISDKDTRLASLRLSPGTKGWLEQVPLSIVVLGDYSQIDTVIDRNLIYVDSCLSVSHLVLAFESSGLSSCLINWKNTKVNNRSAQKLLKLKDTERIVMQIALGYPSQDGAVPFSAKKQAKKNVEVIR